MWFWSRRESPSLQPEMRPLLLIGGTLLGSCVIQAHVLLARSPAKHPQVLCHSLCQPLIWKLPLLWDVSGFTWFREVLQKEAETVQPMLTACMARVTTPIPDILGTEARVAAGFVGGLLSCTGRTGSL